MTPQPWVHVDASMGAAGDMLLAALLDAGADPVAVDRAVSALLPGATIHLDTVDRLGLRAARARVQPPGAADATHRTWADLRRMLRSAELDERVKRDAEAVFERLARAEAHVHGTVPDRIHFHEVGAWDSICDVVGVAAALASLDAGSVSCSPVGVGAGLTETEHGILPVPPPAVAELLREAGAPHEPGPAQFEACTPTGAALLCHFVSSWSDPGPRVSEAVGVGAGTADPPGHPNVLRVFVGAAVAEPVGSVLLETNVDDLDPRLWPAVQAELLAAGAADAWLTPILMKKGRPAMTLSVLCTAQAHDRLVGVVLRHTSAIGLRLLPVTKVAADRTQAEVTVAGRAVRVKIAAWHGVVVNVQPEYDDVAAVARATGQPAKRILAQAQAEAAALWQSPPVSREAESARLRRQNG